MHIICVFNYRMAILASREYTCVHPELVKLKNKSEGCRERLDVNVSESNFFLTFITFLEWLFIPFPNDRFWTLPN